MTKDEIFQISVLGELETRYLAEQGKYRQAEELLTTLNSFLASPDKELKEKHLVTKLSLYLLKYPDSSESPNWKNFFATNKTLHDLLVANEYVQVPTKRDESLFD